MVCDGLKNIRMKMLDFVNRFLLLMFFFSLFKNTAIGQIKVPLEQLLSLFPSRFVLSKKVYSHEKDQLGRPITGVTTFVSEEGLNQFVYVGRSPNAKSILLKTSIFPPDSAYFRCLNTFVSYFFATDSVRVLQWTIAHIDSIGPSVARQYNLEDHGLIILVGKDGAGMFCVVTRLKLWKTN